MAMPWFAVPLLWLAYWCQLREGYPSREKQQIRWWSGWVAANLFAVIVPWVLLAVLVFVELVRAGQRLRARKLMRRSVTDPAARP